MKYRKGTQTREEDVLWIIDFSKVDSDQHTIFLYDREETEDWLEESGLTRKELDLVVVHRVIVGESYSVVVPSGFVLKRTYANKNIVFRKERKEEE